MDESIHQLIFNTIFSRSILFLALGMDEVVPSGHNMHSFIIAPFQCDELK
jgi:hypothetical protein